MKRANFPGRKEQKQREAQARQEAYNKLGTEARIAKAVEAPGLSRKELKRLGATVD
jgi:hypothetical protein